MTEGKGDKRCNEEKRKSKLTVNVWYDESDKEDKQNSKGEEKEKESEG